MPLSALVLKRLHGKVYEGKKEISDGDGLSIRVSPKGKIVFQFRYRYQGNPMRLRLGEYPGMSLSEARVLRDEKLHYLSRGKDPRFHQSAGLVRKQDITVLQCFKYWYENYGEKNRAASGNVYQRVVNNLAKAWADAPAKNLEVSDFAQLFASMNAKCVENNRPSIAITAISDLRTALRFCNRHGLISNTSFEPLTPSDFAPRINVRDRVLSDREIGLIWVKSEGIFYPQNQVLTRMLLIFGCRVGELALAKKSDFNMDEMVWHVPKQNTKTSKSVKRPIPERVRPLIDKALELTPKNSHWMFMNKQQTARVTPNSISNISRVCLKNLDIPPFVVHDFRRTISTRLTDLGCPIHVTEKLLGHSMEGILAVYNKSEMLDELNKWLNIWLDHIAKCVDMIHKEEAL